jgi:hypothetical protein
MVFFSIFQRSLELPLKFRFKSENLFLFGLWFDEAMPTDNVFAPIVHQLCQLERQKMKITLENKVEAVNIVAFSLITDLQGRAKALRVKQHNGRYCCPRCLHPGKNFPKFSGSKQMSSVYYLPHERGKCSPPRTRDQLADIYTHFESHLEAHPDEESTVYGLKHVAVLYFAPHFDIVKDTALEVTCAAYF